MPQKREKTEEQKAKRRAYLDEYYAKNKERIIEKSRKYYKDNAEKCRANQRIRNVDNKDARNAYMKKYLEKMTPEQKQQYKEKQRELYWKALREKHGDEFVEQRLLLKARRKERKKANELKELTIKRIKLERSKKVDPPTEPNEPCNYYSQNNGSHIDDLLQKFYKNKYPLSFDPSLSSIASIQQSIAEARSQLKPTNKVPAPADPNTEPRPTGFRDETDDMIYEGDLIGGWELVDGKMVLDAIPVLWWEEKQIFAVDLSYKKDGSYLEPLHDNFHGKTILGTREKNPHMLYPYPPIKRPNPYK